MNAISKGLWSVLFLFGLAVGCNEAKTTEDISHGGYEPAPGQAQQAAGFGVDTATGHIMDACGNEFVIRGINHAHAWFKDRTPKFFEDIHNTTKANTVRIALSGGSRDWMAEDTPDKVKAIIDLCRQHKLVCVLEDHDTTGYPGESQSINMPATITYWKSLRDVLIGNEGFVIINIGNEPRNDTSASSWVNEAKSAIGQLRDFGYTHAIMVDAPNYGQDKENVMQNAAADILEAYPNTIFSTHMYGEYGTAQKVKNRIDFYVNNKLPFVIGEFGWQHRWENGDGTVTTVDVDEATIMSYSQQKGIGYMAWSWSGNGSPVEALDMANNWDAGNLSQWGKDVEKGIADTAKPLPDGLFASPVECGGSTANYKLTVATTGQGASDGRVLADKAGANGSYISCGSKCEAEYPSGTSVTLSALIPGGPGASFAGWSGACTNQTGDCTVTMNEARSVTAKFDLTYTLQVLASAAFISGSGTITSSPQGINCYISNGTGTGQCSMKVPAGSQFTLTAEPDVGSSFYHWFASCSGDKPTCSGTVQSYLTQVSVAFGK